MRKIFLILTSRNTVPGGQHLLPHGPAAGADRYEGLPEVSCFRDIGRRQTETGWRLKQTEEEEEEKSQI